MEEYPQIESNLILSKEKCKTILQLLEKAGIQQTSNKQWGKGAKLFAALLNLYFTEQHTLVNSPIKELLLQGDSVESKQFSQLLIGLLSPKQLHDLVFQYIDLVIENSNKVNEIFRVDSNTNQLFFLFLKLTCKNYLKLVSSPENNGNDTEPVKWFHAITDKFDQLPISLQEILYYIHKKLLDKFDSTIATDTIMQIFCFNGIAPALLELKVSANTCNIIKQLFTGKEISETLLGYLEKANIKQTSIHFDDCLKRRENFINDLIKAKLSDPIYFSDIKKELSEAKISITINQSLKVEAEQLVSTDQNSLGNGFEEKKPQTPASNRLNRKSSISLPNFSIPSFLTNFSKKQTREHRSQSDQPALNKLEDSKLARKSSYPSKLFSAMRKLANNHLKEQGKQESENPLLLPEDDNTVHSPEESKNKFNG